MNRTLTAALLLAGLFALAALGAGQAHVAVAQTPPPSSKTFQCTQSVQTFEVPVGVTQIKVEAHGAQGGTVRHNSGGSGGQGGVTTATVNVTQGQVLHVYTGCSPSHHHPWGFGHGGGGGNADRPDSSDGWGGGGGSAVTLADGTPLVVAGGGGGGGGNGFCNGGDGGHGGNPPANGEDGHGNWGTVCAGEGRHGDGGSEAGVNGGTGTHSSDGEGGGGGGGGGLSWATPSATGVTFGTSDRGGNGLVGLSWNPAPAPSVTGVSPDYGPATGGTSVTITGSGFSTKPGATQFAVAQFQLTNVVCTSTTRCTAVTPPTTVPAGSALFADGISVAVDGQSSENQNLFFAWYGTPVLTHIGPSSGSSEGGTVVWLTGAVYPNGANYPGPVPTVHFGDAPATAVVCSRPDGTVCGVRSPAGEGRVLVTITTPGGTSSALPFTYTSPDTQAMQVTGSAGIGGLPAPPGMGVQAWVGSRLCGEGPVSLGGRFSLPVHAASAQAGCGTAGAAVSFTLGGMPAVAVPPVVFQPGGQATTTLSASPAPAPAAPTTPAPPRCSRWSGPLALVIPWQNCTG